MSRSLRDWARTIKRDVAALHAASSDPRVPWHAKALAIAVAAYALSPIDLIPDFIPVLGYLDDVVLLPLGIYLVVKLIPREIMEEHRMQADASAGTTASRAAAVIIVGLWIAGSATVIHFAYRYLSAHSAIL